MKARQSARRAPNLTIQSLAFALGLAAANPAHGAGAEATLGWGFEFGGAQGGVEPVYQVGLAAGGTALFERRFRASAAEDPVETAEEAGSSSWIPWVVGGLVAIVAVGASASDESGCNGCVTTEEPRTQISGTEGNRVACVNNECAVCSDGSVASTCDGLVARAMRGESEIDVERQRWLDAGNGHMGDLRR